MLNAAFYSVLTCVVSQVGLGRVGFSVVFEGHKDLLICRPVGNIPMCGLCATELIMV